MFSESSYDLVLVFGSPHVLQETDFLERLRSTFPETAILGASAAGQMLCGEAYAEEVVITALQFSKTTVRSARLQFADFGGDERQAGETLAGWLHGPDLCAVLLFSVGLGVECDQVLAGLRSRLPSEVEVFGGLAADHFEFKKTVVLDHEGVYENGIVCVGFYGNAFRMVSAGSNFDEKSGVDVEITGAEANLIREINDIPATTVYLECLGNHGESLAETALSFPVVILDPASRKPRFLRTTIGVLEDRGSLMMAGGVSEGPARIIDVSGPDYYLEDAKQTARRLAKVEKSFALIVSCAARRGPIGDLWKNEVAGIQEVLGTSANTGFYSYGQIGRIRECTGATEAAVHNCTVCIATFYEG